MLRNLTKVEAALALAIVTTIALMAVVGSMLLSAPADAGSYDSNGRYHLTNTPDTTITTIVVKDAKCLNGEDSASTLVMVQKPKGYDPEDGRVVYHCKNN